MNLEIQLTDQPIPDHLPCDHRAGTGAWVEFRGVVRGIEGGHPIAALEYEAYTKMAESELRRIILALAESFPCLAARVIHRVGIIPVGETAIYIGIASSHRAEAFNLLEAFMDRLKEDVPIWKCRALAKLDPTSPTTQ